LFSPDNKTERDISFKLVDFYNKIIQNVHEDLARKSDAEEIPDEPLKRIPFSFKGISHRLQLKALQSQMKMGGVFDAPVEKFSGLLNTLVSDKSGGLLAALDKIAKSPKLKDLAPQAEAAAKAIREDLGMGLEHVALLIEELEEKPAFADFVKGLKKLQGEIIRTSEAEAEAREKRNRIWSDQVGTITGALISAPAAISENRMKILELENEKKLNLEILSSEQSAEEAKIKAKFRIEEINVELRRSQDLWNSIRDTVEQLGTDTLRNLANELQAMAKKGDTMAALASVGLGGFGVGALGGRVAGSAGGGAIVGGLGGAAQGAIAGSVIPGIGTGLGAIIGGIAGLFGGLFGGGEEEKRQRELAEQAERQRNQQLKELQKIQENTFLTLKTQRDLGDLMDEILNAPQNFALPAAKGILSGDVFQSSVPARAQAATGANVLDTGLALLHKGETVMPAGEAGLPAVGAVNISITGNANPRAVAEEIERHLRGIYSNQRSRISGFRRKFS